MDTGRKVRVAIDGRRLQDPIPGGVARWIAGLLPHLAEAVEMVVLADAGHPAPQVPPGVGLVRLSAPRGAPSLAWLELAARPWLRTFDGIFHGAFYALPLRFRGRGVVTLHDLMPQTRPHNVDQSAPKRFLWRMYARSSVHRARAIVTVSNFVRDEIMRYYRIGGEKLFVVPNAPSSRFSPERATSGREIVRRAGISGRYVVALGGAARRNLPVAVDAWRRARSETGDDVALVVVGNDDLAPEDGLALLRGLDDDEWPAVLAGADALCYPTRDEGYGLPAIEAAASGTPVVCAPVGSLPEVLGDAAAWCEEPTSPATAPVLVRLLRDPAWHARVREAGLARAAAAPTWKDSASVLLRAYELAAS